MAAGLKWTALVLAAAGAVGAAKRTETRWVIGAGPGATHILDASGNSWAFGGNYYGVIGDGTPDPAPTPATKLYLNMVSIEVGHTHALGITAYGALYAWGQNDKGQLGIGSLTASLYPEQVPGGEWVSACAGGIGQISAAIKADGTLWTWGSNGSGALGQGGVPNQLTPSQLWHPVNPPLVNNAWKQVTCGEDNMAAVKVDGSLWTWGYNAYGQLGIGNTTSSNIPVRVGTGQDWASVSCQGHHCLGLKTNGRVYAWGRNHRGQVGDGTTTNRTAPVAVGGTNTETVAITAGSLFSLALRANGSLWSWGDNGSHGLGIGPTSTVPYRTSPGPVISTTVTWTAVKASMNHVVGMRADGSVWTWGIGLAAVLGRPVGELGTPAKVSFPKGMGMGTMAGGGWHSGMVKADGTLWTWGEGFVGQLGLGNFSDYASPTQVTATSPGTPRNIWTQFAGGDNHSVALQARGSLWTTGLSALGRPGGQTHTFGPVGSDETWTRVAAGSNHCLALKSNGTLWAWGSNGSGQLGDNSTTARVTPVNIPVPSSSVTRHWIAVSAGDLHSAGILSDGTLWIWGSGADGRLGLGGTGGRLTPTLVPISGQSANRWVAVACGKYHTLGLRTDGSLWAWGYNNHGQIGIGSFASPQLSPVRIGSDRRWVQITASEAGFYSMAIDANGVAWGWGRNFEYELGDGTTTNRNAPAQLYTPTARSLHAGGRHSLAIVSGYAYSCGRNGEGQLGQGHFNPGTTPNWFAPLD